LCKSCHSSLKISQAKEAGGAKNHEKAYTLLGIAGIMNIGSKGIAVFWGHEGETKLKKKGQTSFKVIGAIAIWLMALVAAVAYINVYANTPGPGGLPPAHWPTESRIGLDGGVPTLLMFAHPRCPCTRASVSELEQIISDCHGRVKAQVWFVQPTGAPEGWTDTSLWRTAAALPDVTVHVDVNGAEAQRFHSGTSGQTLLYSTAGELLFHGGITVARGHEGDNAGVDAIESELNHKVEGPITGSTPVFGCELLGSCTQSDTNPSGATNETGGAAWKP
jgi:hypothetical protein